MKTTKSFSSRELETIRSTIFERTGFWLKDYLIEQAFTRSSYSKRYGGGSNENLEYVGDTIIGYHVVKKLYEHYGAFHRDESGGYYTFRSHEKDFTELKSNIVNNSLFAEIIEDWNLAQYLVVGKCDIDNEVDKEEKIKADLFEAIIGAIAVQVDWNPEILEHVISKVLPIEEIILQYENERYRPPEFSAENAINTLKEMAEHEKCDFPQYKITGPDLMGYNKNGEPRWFCNCSVANWGIIISVTAHSKKDAKKFAAYLVLCNHFELQNEYGKNKQCIFWGYDGKRLFPNPPSDF